MAQILKKALLKEQEDPNFTKSKVASDVYELFEEKRRNMFEVPYCTTEEFQRYVLAWNENILFKSYKTVDHAEVKALHDIFVIRSLRESDVDKVTYLIGPNCKQIKQFSKHKQLKILVPERPMGRDYDRFRKIWSAAARGKFGKHSANIAMAFKEFEDVSVAGRVKSNETVNPECRYKHSVAYAFDSIYDISPRKMIRYILRYNLAEVICTGIFPRSLLWSKKVKHEVLNIEFERRDRDNIVNMYTLNSDAPGYSHKLSVYMQWVHACLNRVSLVWDAIDCIGPYKYFRLYFNPTQMILPYNIRSDVDDKYTIFHPLKYLTRRVYVWQDVSKKPLMQLIDYCMRMKADSFDPANLYAYAASMKYKLVVGSRTIHQPWNATPREMKFAVLFAMCYATLNRGEVYTALTQFIKLSKEGSITSFGFAEMFGRFTDWITLKHSRDLKAKMEDILFSEKEKKVMYRYDPTAKAFKLIRKVCGEEFVCEYLFKPPIHPFHEVVEVKGSVIETREVAVRDKTEDKEKERSLHYVPVPALPESSGKVATVESLTEDFRSYVQDLKLKSQNPANVFKDLHTKVVQALEKVVPAREIPQIVIANMYAGSGKTQDILRTFSENDFYICPSAALRAEFCAAVRAKVKNENKYTSVYSARINTYENALTNNQLRIAKRVFVDECFTLPRAYYAVLFAINPNASYKLVGDVNQRSYMDDYGFLPPDQLITDWTTQFPTVVSNETYRFGVKICDVLNIAFDYDIKAKTDKPARLVADRICNLMNYSKHLILSPTYQTQCFCNDAGLSSITVAQSQGKTAEKVAIIVRSKADAELLNTRAIGIVAFSRATSEIAVITGTDGSGKDYVHKWNAWALLSNNFEQIGFYPVAPDATVVATVDKAMIPDRDKVVERTAKPDAELLGHLIGMQPSDSNMESAVEANPGPPEGSVLPELTVNTMDSVMISTKEVAVLSADMHGKIMMNGTPKPNFATIVKRAARIPPEKSLAGQLRNVKWAIDHINWKFIFGTPFDETEEIGECLRDAEKHFRAAAQSVEGELPLSQALQDLLQSIQGKSQLGMLQNMLSQSELIVREHIKTQNKPKGAEGAYEDKVGQPIKAWTKTLNAAFGILFRAVQLVQISMLNEKITINYKMTDDEVMDKLHTLHQHAVEQGCESAEMDFKEYDNSQSEKTVYLEIEGYKKMLGILGMDFECKEFFRYCRVEMKVVGPYASYVCETRHSGGPDTFLGNTMVNIYITSSFAKAEDWVALFVGGDDSVSWALKFKPYEDEVLSSDQGIMYVETPKGSGAKGIRKVFFRLEPKKAEPRMCDVCLKTVVEFCGFCCCYCSVSYDTVRLARKFLNKDAFMGDRQKKLNVNERFEHRIAEWQQGLYDKLKSCPISQSACIAGHNKIDVETVNIIRESLCNFAKCKPMEVISQLKLMSLMPTAD